METATEAETKNWGAEQWRLPEKLPEDIVIFSECGRALGNVCYRSHWLIFVLNGRDYAILVRHGGGQERHKLWHGESLRKALAFLDPDDRYLALYSIYDVISKTAREAARDSSHAMQRAFLDGRMKKRRRNGGLTVYIEPAEPEMGTHSSVPVKVKESAAW